MTNITTQEDIAYLAYLIRTVPILPGDTHHGTSGRRQYILDFNSDCWFSHSCSGSPDRQKTASEIAEQRIRELATVDFQIAGMVMSSPELGKIIEFSQLLRDTVKTNAKAIHANNPAYDDRLCWDRAEELAAELVRPDARKYVEDLLCKHSPEARRL
jgi:hypothetical protein